MPDSRCPAPGAPPQAGGAWVFGYGSLMWRPGFEAEEIHPALLRGYHRALCVYSWHHRGTRDRPGLVLGLDRGGSCRGRAFRVTAARVAATLAYLDDRELITDVYRPAWLPVTLDDGRRVVAYTFVARPDHEQYAGALPAGRAAALVRQGVGQGGSSLDYLANTVAHLDALGIGDGPLHRLLAAVADRGEPGLPNGETG